MDEINLLNDPEMKEIFESFIVETNEILEKLDTDLVQLEKTPTDNELLNSVFRAFHTIKGTSGFLGLEKLQTVTHHCEDILNKLRKGEAELNTDLMDGILSGFDKIKELVVWIEQNKNENVDIDETLTVLKTQLSNIENKIGKESVDKAEEVNPEGKLEQDNTSKRWKFRKHRKNRLKRK